MKILGKIMLGRALPVAFLAYAGWQAWVFTRPRPEPFSDAQIRSVEAVGDALRERLAAADPTTGARVGLAHFRNDPTDKVTRAVRASLTEHPDWTVVEDSPIRQAMADISKTLTEATSLDEVINASRRVDLDYVVAGRVVEVGVLEDGGARAVIDVSVFDVNAVAWLFRETLTATWSPNWSERIEAAVARTAVWKRAALGSLIVLLLPWLTAFATRHAVELKSNVASIVLLVGYSSVDLLTVLLLSGFKLLGVASGLGLMGVLLVCAGYNYWACEQIAGKR